MYLRKKKYTSRKSGKIQTNYFVRVKKGEAQREKSLRTSKKKEADRIYTAFDGYCLKQGVHPYDVLDDILHIAASPEYQPSLQPMLTVSQAIQLFLDEKKEYLRRSSIVLYRSQMRCFYRSLKYDMLVSALQPHHYRDYIFHNPDWSPTTQKNKGTMLKTWYMFLCSRQLTTSSFPDLTYKKPDHDSSRKMLTKYEMEEVIACNDKEYNRTNRKSRPWFAPALRLMYAAALRRKELVSLRVCDIDIDEQLVKVSADVAKNGQTRLIPVPAHIIQENMPFIIGKSENSKLYGISVDTLYSIFRERAATAGYPDATPHGLRHARITEWLNMGFSTIETAKMAGHNDITSTMKYEHLTMKQLSEKLKKLDPGNK